MTIFRGMEAGTNHDRHIEERENIQNGKEAIEGIGYNEEEASKGKTNYAKESLLGNRKIDQG